MCGPGRFRLANPPGRNRTGPTTAAGHFKIRSTPFRPLHIPTVDATAVQGRQPEWPSRRLRFSGRTVGASQRLFQHTSLPTGMPGSPAMSVGESGYTVRTGLFVAIHFVGEVEAV
jgi:hypothetical protein